MTRTQLSLTAALAVTLSIVAAMDAKAAVGVCDIGEAKKLELVFKNSDEASLRLDPQGAVGRGDMRYADQFGDYVTDDYLAAQERQAREDLRAIRSVDRRALCDRDRLAYDVFLDQSQLAVEGFDQGVQQINQQLAIDHYFGKHVSFPDFSSGDGIAPFKTTNDYDNGLKRLQGFASYLDNVQVQLRRGSASGHVQHRVIVERLIAQLTDAIDAPEASALLGPTRKFPEAFPSSDRERFERLYRTAMFETVVPAYHRLRTFLQTEYLPKARTGAPGLATMPDGARLYAFALKLHTTTAMTAAEIHQLGLTEVRRIQGEMDTIRRDVGFSGSLQDFFAFVRSNERFKFKTKQDMIAAYGKVQAQVEPLLPRFFARLPKGKLEIREVRAEQASAVGAYYVPGTPDGARPGVFFLNTADLAGQSSTTVTSLFLHEGVPGHHLQGSLTQEDESLPEFLRFGWNTGYGEGWALYAEWLGIEMGLYQDPYQNFGHLQTEIFRAARLVVDTGLHAQGWSREKAIAYLQKNTPLDPKFIEQEVDRYIVWPGQATAYKVGELFIRRLRAKAEKQLGPRFDVRLFHDEILNAGALPLSVLEAKLDAWIERHRTGTQ